MTSNLDDGLGNSACFHKIQSAGLPKHLLQLVSTNNHSYVLRKYYFRTDTLKNSFFPNVMHEWDKLDKKIKGATSFSLFKTSVLKMDRRHDNSTNKIHNLIGIRLVTRLRLGLSHFNEWKCRHNFIDCMNRLCSFSINLKTMMLNLFLLCHNSLNIKNYLIK